MRKNLCRKLRSSRGESIAEVLVAVLIAAVGLVLLAGMLTSGTHMIQRSKEKMESFYAAEEDLTKGESSALAGTGTATVKLSGDATVVPLKEGSMTLPVSYYSNSEAGDTLVISFR